MKKISRFRKWLIHKLGGVTPSEHSIIHYKEPVELPPLTFTASLKFVDIKVEVRIPANVYREQPDYLIERKAMKMVKEELMLKIKPTIVEEYNEERQEAIIKGSITIAALNAKEV